VLEVTVEYATILLVCALLTALSTLGGWVFKLSGRLAQADAKADAAALTAERAGLVAQALRVALDQNERDLQEHRVTVAKEYVSNETIKGLEDKLIKAIDRLGDRLDTLFTTRTSQISG
jgi:Flp pilus assembly pilin Flp